MDYNFACPNCNAPYSNDSADTYCFNYFDPSMNCAECGKLIITEEIIKQVK